MKPYADYEPQNSGDLVGCCAALVRVRAILKSSPLALEKLLGQLLTRLVEHKYDTVALLVSARIGELLLARTNAADRAASPYRPEGEGITSPEKILALCAACQKDPSVAAEAVLRSFPVPSAGTGDSGTTSIATTCACMALRCMLRLGLGSHAAVFAMGTARLWAVRLLKIGRAAGGRGAGGRDLGSDAASRAGPGADSRGRGESSRKEGYRSGGGELSAGERAVLSVWKQREVVSRLLLQASRQSAEGDRSGRRRAGGAVQSLALAVAATCWSVALAPAQGVPAALLRAFRRSMASGTGEGDYGLDRLCERGVILSAVRNYHAACSAIRRLRGVEGTREEGVRGVPVWDVEGGGDGSIGAAARSLSFAARGDGSDRLEPLMAALVLATGDHDSRSRCVPWEEVLSSGGTLVLRFLSSRQVLATEGKERGAEGARRVEWWASKSESGTVKACFAPEYVVWLESAAVQAVAADRPSRSTYQAAGAFLDRAEEHCDSVLRWCKEYQQKLAAAEGLSGGKGDEGRSSGEPLYSDSRCEVATEEVTARGAAAGICMLRSMMAAQRAAGVPKLAASKEATGVLRGARAAAATPAGAGAELSRLRAAGTAEKGLLRRGAAENSRRVYRRGRGEEDEDGGNEEGEGPEGALAAAAAGESRQPRLARSLFGGGGSDESSDHGSMALVSYDGNGAELDMEAAIAEQQGQLASAFSVFRRAASHVSKLHSAARRSVASFAGCSEEPRLRLARAVADAARCTERARRLLGFWQEHPLLASGDWRLEDGAELPPRSVAGTARKPGRGLGSAATTPAAPRALRFADGDDVPRTGRLKKPRPETSSKTPGRAARDTTAAAAADPGGSQPETALKPKRKGKAAGGVRFAADADDSEEDEDGSDGREDAGGKGTARKVQFGGDCLGKPKAGKTPGKPRRRVGFASAAATPSMASHPPRTAAKSRMAAAATPGLGAGVTPGGALARSRVRGGVSKTPGGSSGDWWLLLEQVFVLLSRYSQLALDAVGTAGYGAGGEASSWRRAACFRTFGSSLEVDAMGGEGGGESPQAIGIAASSTRRYLCVRLVDAGRAAVQARLHRVANRLRHSSGAAYTARKLRLGDGGQFGGTASEGDEEGTSSVRRLLFGGGKETGEATGGAGSSVVAVDPALAAGDEDLFGLVDDEDNEDEDSGRPLGSSTDDAEALHHADKVAAYAWPALCAARSAGGRTGLDANRALCALLHNAAADHADAGAASAAARLQVVCAAAWHCIVVPSSGGRSEAPGSSCESFVAGSRMLSSGDTAVGLPDESPRDPAKQSAQWLGVSRGDLLKAARVPKRYESAARCLLQASIVPDRAGLARLCLLNQATVGAQLAVSAGATVSDLKSAADAASGILYAAMRVKDAAAETAIAPEPASGAGASEGAPVGGRASSAAAARIQQATLLYHFERIAAADHLTDQAKNALFAGACIAVAEVAASAAHRLGVLRLRPPGGSDHSDLAAGESTEQQATLATVSSWLLNLEPPTAIQQGPHILRSIALAHSAEALVSCSAASGWVAGKAPSCLDAMDDALTAGYRKRSVAEAGTDGDVEEPLHRPGGGQSSDPAVSGPGVADTVSPLVAIDAHKCLTKAAELSSAAWEAAKSAHDHACDVPNDPLAPVFCSLAGCLADAVSSLVENTATAFGSAADLKLTEAESRAWSPWSALSAAAAAVEKGERLAASVQVFALARRTAAYGLQEEQSALRRAGLALARAADCAGGENGAEHLAQASIHSVLAGDALAALQAAEEAATDGPPALRTACKWAASLHAFALEQASEVENGSEVGEGEAAPPKASPPALEGLAHGLRALRGPEACAFACGIAAVLSQAMEASAVCASRAAAAGSSKYLQWHRSTVGAAAEVVWEVMRALEARATESKDRLRAATGSADRDEAARQAHLIKVAVAVASEHAAVVLQLRGHRAQSERLLAHGAAAWLGLASHRQGDGGMQSTAVGYLPSVHEAVNSLGSLARDLRGAEAAPLPTVVSQREAGLRRVGVARLAAAMSEAAEYPRRSTRVLRRAAFQADCFAASGVGGNLAAGVLADAAVLLARRGRCLELGELLLTVGSWSHVSRGRKGETPGGIAFGNALCAAIATCLGISAAEAGARMRVERERAQAACSWLATASMAEELAGIEASHAISAGVFSEVFEGSSEDAIVAAEPRTRVSSSPTSWSSIGSTPAEAQLFARAIATPNPALASLWKAAASSTAETALCAISQLATNGLCTKLACAAGRSAVAALLSDGDCTATIDVLKPVAGKALKRTLAVWHAALTSSNLAARLEGDRALLRALSAPIAVALASDDATLLQPTEIIGDGASTDVDSLRLLQGLPTRHQVACVLFVPRFGLSAVCTARRTGASTFEVRCARTANYGPAESHSARIQAKGSSSGSSAQYCEGAWPVTPAGASCVPIAGDAARLRGILWESFESMKAAGSPEAQKWSSSARKQWWARREAIDEAMGGLLSSIGGWAKAAARLGPSVPLPGLPHGDSDSPKADPGAEEDTAEDSDESSHLSPEELEILKGLPANLSSLKVVELREILSSLKLPGTGRKSQLVETLRSWRDAVQDSDSEEDDESGRGAAGGGGGMESAAAAGAGGQDAGAGPFAGHVWLVLGPVAQYLPLAASIRAAGASSSVSRVVCVRQIRRLVIAAGGSGASLAVGSTLADDPEGSVSGEDVGCLGWDGEAYPTAWAGVSRALAAQAVAMHLEASGPEADRVSLSEGRFVIDPEGDLAKSRERMLEVVKGLASGKGAGGKGGKTASAKGAESGGAAAGYSRIGRWAGHAGAKPEPSWMLGALAARGMVLYCGHGAGERCLDRDALLSQGGVALARKRARAAVVPWAPVGGAPGEGESGDGGIKGTSEGTDDADDEQALGAPVVLSGCSSARLRLDGSYAPGGLALAYSLGQHRHVFGNLWEVTDKELDGSIGALLGALQKGGEWTEAVGSAEAACRLRSLTAGAQVHYGAPLKAIYDNEAEGAAAGGTGAKDAGGSSSGPSRAAARRAAPRKEPRRRGDARVGRL